MNMACLKRDVDVFSSDIPNRAPALIIISIVFLILTTAFFAFRQGWRWAHRQRGMDDVMAACAYTTLLIMTVFGGMATHYGFGKHRDDIVPTFPEAMKYFYLYQICYKLIGAFTKLTFCFLYLRIFNDQTLFHYITYAVMAIVTVGSLAFTLGTIFQCLPVHRAWDRRVRGTCISNVAFWYSHAAFNTFFDIVVYLLPIPLIRSLKLRREQKTGVISIFAFGAFVIAASIVRMVELRQSAHTNDSTWGSMIALIWTEVEANTSVIICCLPALRMPLLNLWHRAQGRTSRSRTSTTNETSKAERSARGGACDGRQHGQWMVNIDGPESHKQVQDANHGIRTNVTASNMRSDHLQSTNPQTSRNNPEQTWYDKVMAAINQNEAFRAAENSASRDSSMDGLSRTEAAIPPRLELGAIYKTTDVHVSTDPNATRKKREHGEDYDRKRVPRQMNLMEMLNAEP
ncbi:hypothetical protein KC332_g5689 [Hortaea werneckii]|uniref:Rhodopsin domain-containing protein n=2 Tax=Hortaea werneckii TaxID=91943 RepID=A0A3M7IH75_HORWE|nr:hypothetical protein KC358_g6461 [Hortaea werneckii]OTA23573.1 hypothetical protein BTJ68_12993 [Hortaea werneckii EXF-2000]KAI6836559.1 hypothetical protein KC350_g6263 [Hortaea werneckii]KAI6936305.1 hypothetical protein KC341_g6314 [Hortaea werneckii]KAI6938338.1 hypothetical protein KC348_g5512 [Hortaea werneckii]